MKNTRWTILAALLLAASSVAHAQEPGAPMEGGAPAAGATTDSGAVTNAQTTTTTTTSSTGIAPDGLSGEADTMMAGETTEMANTGGEPILMSLLGLSMAMGALALRKRVSA